MWMNLKSSIFMREETVNHTVSFFMNVDTKKLTNEKGVLIYMNKTYKYSMNLLRCSCCGRKFESQKYNVGYGTETQYEYLVWDTKQNVHRMLCDACATNENLDQLFPDSYWFRSKVRLETDLFSGKPVYNLLEFDRKEAKKLGSNWMTTMVCHFVKSTGLPTERSIITYHRNRITIDWYLIPIHTAPGFRYLLGLDNINLIGTSNKFPIPKEFEFKELDVVKVFYSEKIEEYRKRLQSLCTWGEKEYDISKISKFTI